MLSSISDKSHSRKYQIWDSLRNQMERSSSVISPTTNWACDAPPQACSSCLRCTREVCHSSLRMCKVTPTTGFMALSLSAIVHCCVHLVLPPILQACYGCPESSISKLEIEREIPKQLFCTFTTHSLTHLALPKMTGGEGLINLVPVIDDCYTPQIIYGTVKSLLQGIGCV